jgi:hypothetical protein
MWWTLGLDLSVVVVLLLLWYGLCVRWNHRRGRRLLAKIESAFSGYGHVCGVEWQSGSQFQVRLRLNGCAFSHSTVTVRLYPLHKPLGWIVARLRHEQETLTFDANLLCPPAFNLDVRNQRRVVKVKSRRPPKGAVVHLHRLGPFVLTSRRDWHRDVANTVQSLAGARDCELIAVSFRRSAPHFSATLPLETISGLQSSRARVFDSLRELASGASAARL